MEQMRYNMLFRWLVDLSMDDAESNHSVFSKNRGRLLDHEVLEAFFSEVMTPVNKQGLLSKESFSVDDTLIQACASRKSVVAGDGADDGQPQGGGRNRQAKWKSKRRSDDTHASTTDPDVRLYKKGGKMLATLRCQGHVLMENRVDPGRHQRGQPR